MLRSDSASVAEISKKKIFTPKSFPAIASRFFSSKMVWRREDLVGISKKCYLNKYRGEKDIEAN